MLTHALPAFGVLAIWWISTGVILFLDGLAPRSFRWSLLGAGILAAIGLAGLIAAAATTTPTGAFAAFLCALLVWGFNEMAFLMGHVTGPNRQPCPAEATGWRRFRLATRTIIDHELAILASAVLVAMLTWNALNQVGLWTFLVLWIMRLSTKLNIFLGASNVPVDFLPPHLEYLKSYFRRAPMNALFPVAITLATALTALLAQAALAQTAAFEATALTIIATLMALAVIEHWFLMVPLPSSSLWAWGMGSHKRRALALRDGLKRPDRRGHARTDGRGDYIATTDDGPLDGVKAPQRLGAPAR